MNSSCLGHKHVTHVHFGSRPKWTGGGGRPKQRLCFSCPSRAGLAIPLKKYGKLVQMAYTKTHWLAMALDAGKPLGITMALCKA